MKHFVMCDILYAKNMTEVLRIKNKLNEKIIV